MAATVWAAPGAQPYDGIGRTAAPAEVAAWDIDVRPDFKGLPPGSGSVKQGQDIWEAKCASCHGVFGESNQTFSPLVGGTTAADIQTGHAARLNDPAYPGRTTMMKLANLSTLWDYIRRAMPWNAPKSLSNDEVYAVTAYLLNLGGVMADDAVLSNTNIAAVQQRLPNRNGLSTDHGLWPGKGLGNGGRPDVHAAPCMRNCAAEPKLASLLPDFARNAHGNLAAQNRGTGAQVGADTTKPPGAVRQPAPTPAPAAATSPDPIALARRLNCLTCHGMDNRVVGPGLTEVAKKYAGRADAVVYLAGRIRNGGSGLWGAIPMPPQTLSDADLQTLASWLAAGAPRP